MLMDSREDGLSYNPEELVSEPIGTEVEETPVDARSVEEDDPVSLPEPDRESWVRCKRCGETLHEEDAVLFSEGPPLGDIWIHGDGCPETEETEVDS
jgi:formylmethanofuran dehydrogenase subunit E